MLKADYFIISFISRDWETYQRVPHYMAIARYTKVLCVEPPLTIFDAVFRPGRIWRQRFKIKNRLRQVNKNLFIYTPIALAPFGLSYRNSLLSRLNRLFITHDVERLIRHLQIKKYISIIHAPHLSCLVDILNPLVRVYEVSDERGTSAECPNLDKSNSTVRLIEREEKKILASVDIVFATSKKLYERKRIFNKNTYFIPNGVDLEHFWTNNYKRLPDITAIPRPRIGHVGFIHAILNFEWLDYCVDKHPEWSFVFLGAFHDQKTLNRDNDFRRFIKRKNVFMLGWKKYEDLPAYMREIDVFLLPRKDSDYSRNSNPNKIYQYLSTGRPIVSSRFDSIEPFKDCIYISDDKKTFLENIEKAIFDTDEQLKKIRLGYARGNDLTLRAKEKLNIVNDYILTTKGKMSQ